MSALDVLVRTLPTPNPQAIKFVSNFPIKNQGKATFENNEDPQGVRLAEDLFSIDGVKQLHMFENVVTVTFAEDADESKLKEAVTSVLKTRLPVHDPDFILEAERKRDRSHLSPELQEIEKILDETIRPALQGDGGDIEVIALEDHVLKVMYQGACGTCPSSMYGTLEAIKGILQDQYDPDIDVQAINEGY